MPKINNQAVVQKLVDELGLYPGVDQIPTELAEKILPVFNVNKESVEVEVVTPKADIIVYGVSTGTITTIYTTPTTGKFYLTNVTINSSWNSNGVSGNGISSIGATINGSTVSILTVPQKFDAGETNGNTGHNSLQLANPILIDAGTPLTVDDGLTGAVVSITTGTIVGYVEG